MTDRWEAAPELLRTLKAGMAGRDVARRQSDDFFSVLTDEEQDSLLRILRKVYESYVDTVPSPG